MKSKFVTLLLLAATTASVHAVTISQWTFESGTAGNPPSASGTDITAISPVSGTGTASGHHASSATAWSNPVGNGSGESFSANNWTIGDYFQFQVSTLGYQDIVVSWNQTRSSSGPASFDFTYSLNGSTFTVALDNYIVPSVPWASGTPDSTGTTSFSVNLSAVLGLNNISAAYFRLTADSSPTGTTPTAGTGRTDNFKVEGATYIPPTTGAVPETLPFGFAAATLLAVLVLARRFQAKELACLPVVHR